MMMILIQKYWWLVAIFLTAVALAIHQAVALRDGMNASGFYDDDTEGAILKRSTSSPAATYKQSPLTMRNFKISDFDSPDVVGSGENMNVNMLKMLDNARDIAGVPFKINSAFRTIEHNKKVGGVGDSAHTKGYAADISAKTDEVQRIILKAAFAAGFRRFGVYGTFIHMDNDPNKSQAIWTGKGGVIKYNPLTA